MNFYPESVPSKTQIDYFLDNFNKFLKNKKKIWLIGRVMTIREHGKISFIKLQDFYGQVQIVLKDESLKDYSKLLILY
jgi:lysyl-tRNA synthetase class II